MQQGLRRAKDHGFESQYDLLRFLNVMFTVGGDFDAGEEHSWMRPILTSRDMAPSTRMDLLLHELYSRLIPGYNPETPDESPKDAQPEADEGPREFDGILWEDDLDPNYVPQSIAPAILSYERGPAPESVLAPAIEKELIAEDEDVLVLEGEDRGWE